MPNKELILSARIESQSDLIDKFAGLHMRNQCSQSQVSSMIETMRKYLPCSVRVYCRTPKGTIYLNVIGETIAAFIVSPRAKIALVLDLSDD